MEWASFWTGLGVGFIVAVFLIGVGAWLIYRKMSSGLVSAAIKKMGGFR